MTVLLLLVGFYQILWLVLLAQWFINMNLVYDVVCLASLEIIYVGSAILRVGLYTLTGMLQ